MIEIDNLIISDDKNNIVIRHKKSEEFLTSDELQKGYDIDVSKEQPHQKNELENSPIKDFKEKEYYVRTLRNFGGTNENSFSAAEIEEDGKKKYILREKVTFVYKGEYRSLSEGTKVKISELKKSK